MSSVCERGYVQFNPDLNDEYDMEHGDVIYEPSKYPLSIPKIYFDSSFDKYCLDWSDDSTIVINDGILTKYNKHSFFELLAEDENGNEIWVDERTAPYVGCWKGKYLGEVRDVSEYDIEEFHLNTLEKKKYKVTLESTSRMDMDDFFRLVDYIDPEIIKRISTNKDTNPN